MTNNNFIYELVTFSARYTHVTFTPDWAKESYGYYSSLDSVKKLAEELVKSGELAVYVYSVDKSSFARKNVVKAYYA